MGSVYLGSLLEICMLSGHKSNPSSGIVNVFQEFDVCFEDGLNV